MYAAVPMLNEQQQMAYNKITDSVNKVKHFKKLLNMRRSRVTYPDIQNCFFIDGLDGPGKTFLYNSLLSSIRANNEIALVASSCIFLNCCIAVRWQSDSSLKAKNSSEWN